MSEKIFDPDMVSLNTLLTHVYSIPVYQRPYSWGKEQIEDLYSDLISNYDSREPDVYRGIFTGTIYLKQAGHIRGKYTNYSVIDGQQRLTTFTLMLLAIYCIAKERSTKDKDLCSTKKMEIIKDFLWKEVDEKNCKDIRLLELGNLDKSLLIQIFDNAFSGSNSIIDFLNSFENLKSDCEKLIINNFKFFFNRLSEKFENTDDGNKQLNNFVDYIITATQFVVIYVTTPLKQVFEIFESINSKGKKLDEIDLIKSYIFQIVPDDDHKTYLQKWGKLIEDTNDELESYLSVFIRAYIKYYKVSLNVKMFKKLCNDELPKYYKVKTSEEAVKKLIDDLQSKVACFNMLSDEKNLPKSLKKAKFLFYYNSLNYFGYHHPKFLLFKSLCQLVSKTIDSKTVENIFQNSLVFMLTYQTINNRDSKDAIPTFEKIATDDYGINSLDKSKVKNVFASKLKGEDISAESLKHRIREYKGYANQDKSETIVLLAYFESLEKKKISYDNANIILKNRSMFAIDHILPRNPKENDKKFKYYKKKNDSGEFLVLKKGHDFPVDDGIEYSDFEDRILHKLGNLRIILSSDNREKSNLSVKLGEYGDFNTYKKISTRAQDLAEKLYNSELLTLQ